MNYAYLKSLKQRIKKQQERVVAAKANIVSLSATMSDMPKTKSNNSQIEVAIENAEFEEYVLQRLETKLKNIIANIPNMTYQEMIYQKLIENRSWTYIAMHRSGNNTPDGVRMACYRYWW